MKNTIEEIKNKLYNKGYLVTAKIISGIKQYQIRNIKTKQIDLITTYKEELKKFNDSI